MSEMATNQELTSVAAAVKSRTNRTPSSRSIESAAGTSIPRAVRRRKNTDSKTLYDIDVIEERADEVKIHYVGYEAKYDEWIKRTDVVYRPPRTPESYEETSPLYQLACNIKQRLWPSKVEDPAVRIYMPFCKEDFERLAAIGEPTRDVRGRRRYRANSYSSLSELLGEHWYFRVANSHGDFSYAILDTISFHLFRSRPLKDFAVEVSEDGLLKFSPAYIEQGHSLCFSFVRGDGNKHKLKEFLEQA